MRQPNASSSAIRSMSRRPLTRVGPVLDAVVLDRRPRQPRQPMSIRATKCPERSRTSIWVCVRRGARPRSGRGGSGFPAGTPRRRRRDRSRWRSWTIPRAPTVAVGDGGRWRPCSSRVACTSASRRMTAVWSGPDACRGRKPFARVWSTATPSTLQHSSSASRSLCSTMPLVRVATAVDSARREVRESIHFDPCRAAAERPAARRLAAPTTARPRCALSLAVSSASFGT